MTKKLSSAILLIAVILLFPGSSFAMIRIPGPGGAPASGGGGGGPTLVAAGSGQTVLDAQTSATITVNTTGVDFMLSVADSAGITPSVDTGGTQGVTWGTNTIGPQTGVGGSGFTGSYIHTPTVSASYAVKWNLRFGHSAVLSFSGFSTGTYDTGKLVLNSNASASSISPGTLTPSTNGSIIVTDLYTGGSNVTIDAPSGFTIVSDLNSASSGRHVVAWKYQATAAAVTPTWSQTGSTFMGSTMIVFKP
ncbi:MAG: hypothetical protein V4473_02265 [Patescibacteria group bacterium]